MLVCRMAVGSASRAPPGAQLRSARGARSPDVVACSMVGPAPVPLEPLELSRVAGKVRRCDSVARMASRSEVDGGVGTTEGGCSAGAARFTAVCACTAPKAPATASVAAVAMKAGVRFMASAKEEIGDDENDGRNAKDPAHEIFAHDDLRLGMSESDSSLDRAPPGFSQSTPRSAVGHGRQHHHAQPP